MANTAEVVATVRALGDVADVAIAYDADAETNAQVAHHEAKLARELAAAGFRIAQ